MPHSLPHCVWRFRPDLWQMELRDMPGSLLGALLPDALSVGTPRYPVIGPQFHPTTMPNARPSASADEFYTGPVLPVETPAAKGPSAKASAEDSDPSARRKRSLDDLLPDWLERVSVTSAHFLHAPAPESQGGSAVGGPVEFAAAPNFRSNGGSVPAAGMSDSGEEGVADLPVRTSSAAMMMGSGSPPATVNAYDPEAAELVDPPGPTTGLLEFVRADGTSGDLEVIFRIAEGPGQATFANDYDLRDTGGLIPVNYDIIGGKYGLYGSVMIPSAAPSAAVRVEAKDDQEVEPPETVEATVVQVNELDVPTADQTRAVVTIADNDPIAGPVQQKVWVGRVDATAQENYESTDQWNAGKIELRRSVAAGMLSVNYDATAGNATLNTDYSLWGPVATGYYNQISYAKLSGTGKVTFADGQDRLWVDVKPIWSGGEAAYETVEYKITSGSGYVPDTPDKATVGVYGDRPPGSTTQPNPYGDYTHNPLMDVFLEAPDATAAEAGGDPGSLRVRYKYWSEDAGFVPPDPPVPMYVLGGTAKAGEDYLATATRESVDVYTEYTNPTTGLTVYSVTSVYRIDVTPTDDAELEGDEDIDIAVPRAGSDNGGLIGVARITLADNDAAAVPTVWVEPPDSVSTEWQLSTGSFRIVRDETKLAYPLTVSYEFGGSATYAADYAPAVGGGTLSKTGTVTFAAGQKTVEVKISPLLDADATGDEVVELTVPDGAGYAASAIAGTAAVVIKAAQGEKRVIITDRYAKQVTPQNGLKIAKWQYAFKLTADGKGVEIWGTDADNHDFIDRDDDRFNVWVYDPTAWNAETERVQVTIETTNAAGFTAYNDNPTAVDLVRYTGTAKGEKGWYWSDSQMLVSNDVDDDFKAEGGLDEPGYLRDDDQTPGDNAIPKNDYIWKLSDRTHRIALGGTILATYGALSAKAQVKVEKVVKLNLHIMRDKPLAQGGVLAAPRADVEGYATKMREIYGQIGIRVEWNIYEQDPPEGLDLSDGLEYSESEPITSEAKLLLADKPLPNRTTAERSRIEVYFVSNVHLNLPNFPKQPWPGSRGQAYARDGVWDAKYADSVIIQMGKGTNPPQGVPPYMVLAHECGHILENIRRVSKDNTHYPYADPLPPLPDPLDTVNLMVRGDRAEVIGAVDNEVTDARRLNVEQQNRMKEARKNLLSGP